MSAALDALEKGRLLAEQGDVESAVLLFRRVAAEGVAEGYIELSRIERERGNESAAMAYLKAAEDLAEKGDALANLSCSLAYQLSFGEGDLEQQQAKANMFLRRAAELGNALAQTMLAQQLLWGANGQNQDETEYYLWITRAIDQDLDDAIVTHIHNLLQLKLPIEAGLKSKLERVAVRSNQARGLLRLLS